MNNIIEPKVSTITAELHVVKIGNKQMTKSVYNQLYEEQCYDKDYNLLYDIWGKTNIEGNYVIFNKNGELRKCIIPKYTPFHKSAFEWHVISFLRRHSTIAALNELLNEEQIKNITQLIIIRDYDYITVSDARQAMSYLTDDIINVIKSEYAILVNENNALKKLIDTLNNSTQLFIAV
jgi:hypothetical protein